MWERFGNAVNYVEPFAGSLAVLLGRPHDPRNETVNDLDCFIANFWRATQNDPEKVAHFADNPVNEADLHARHQWLHNQKEFIQQMHADPDHFNAKVAGWWVWGISSWIGDNWCNPNRNSAYPKLKGQSGIHRKKLWNARPMIGKGGNGINAVSIKRPTIRRGGVGIHRQKLSQQLPDISGNGGASGRGTHAKYCQSIAEYFELLKDRLRRVRVCCGQWHRILGQSPTTCIGTTAVFLDPPYGVADRDLVYNHDSKDVSADVLDWCTEHGDNKKLRIALCGYDGEHNSLEPLGWRKIAWKAGGGYGARNKENNNSKRERIWFSPHCLTLTGTLFADPNE